MNFNFFAVHALANKKFPGDFGFQEKENVDFLRAIRSPDDSPPDPLPLFQKRDNLLL